jgi:hypothetical protein
MRRKIRTGLVFSIVAAVLFVAGPARAADGYGSQFAWGMAAIGANVLYIPTKLVYAGLGGLTGGLGYLLTLGNRDALNTVLGPSVGGTYVLTPEMLRGEQPILFSGESPD